MSKFLAKFIFFNITILLAWFVLHAYYEAILWFSTIKASQIIGPISLTHPEIVNGDFICRAGGARSHFAFPTLMIGIFITIPLLLSTSGVTLANKIKITMIGFLFLFLFQILLLLVVVSFQYYKDYPMLLQKYQGIDRVIKYTPMKHAVFSWLSFFFKSIFQFAVAVGIWIGLVSYYKRTEKQNWVTKML